MAELVDAPDSKSGGSDIVGVRFPLPAPIDSSIWLSATLSGHFKNAFCPSPVHLEGDVASIRKHGNGWQARISRKGHSAIAQTFLHRNDAERWARQTETEIDRGIHFRTSAAENVRLRELIERYRTEVTAHKKGAEQELMRLDRWSKHPLADKTLRRIRSHDIAKYRNDRINAGRSNNTVRLEMAILSHLFTIARKEWGFEGLDNPFANVRSRSFTQCPAAKLERKGV